MNTDTRLAVCHCLVIIQMTFEQSQGHLKEFIDFKQSGIPEVEKCKILFQPLDACSLKDTSVNNYIFERFWKELLPFDRIIFICTVSYIS